MPSLSGGRKLSNRGVGLPAGPSECGGDPVASAHRSPPLALLGVEVGEQADGGVAEGSVRGDAPGDLRPRIERRGSGLESGADRGELVDGDPSGEVVSDVLAVGRLKDRDGDSSGGEGGGDLQGVGAARRVPVGDDGDLEGSGKAVGVLRSPLRNRRAPVVSNLTTSNSTSPTASVYG